MKKYKTVKLHTTARACRELIKELLHVNIILTERKKNTPTTPNSSVPFYG